jgi:hypothetical protein
MAKTRISEYDAVAANNTDVNSINIAEGCAPSGINNAIRQVMADLKDFQQGTKSDPFLGPISTSSLTASSLTANRVLYTNGSKVMSTSDNMQFDGTTTTINALTVSGAFAANGGATLGDGSGDALTINSSAVSIPNGLNFGSNNLVLSGGNVGIGISSPLSRLHVSTATSEIVSRYIASANSSSFNLYGDSGTTVFPFIGSNGNALTFGAYGTSERMRIDSSGNVGIGTTTSTAYSNYVNNTVFRTVSSVSDSSTSSGSNIGQLAIDNIDTTTNNYSKLAFTTSDGGNRVVASGIYTQVTARTSGNFVSSNMQFWTGTTGSPPAERMRIDSSGNLLVGTTSNTINANGFIAQSDGVAKVTSTSDPLIVNRRSSTGTLVLFYNDSVLKGSISTNGSTVSYNTSSDYRLKENIAPMTGALATVSALKPVTYNWKEDGSSGQGFIAHELQEVVPECVTGEKDAVDAEGNPKYQGIDTSFLVATLTAAIQELKAEVDALKAQINQ